MPKSRVLTTAIAAAFAIGGAGAAIAVHAASHHYAGEKYAKEAKISLADARATALKAVPGKITDQELERERGGSGLRYSFDVRQGSVTREVGVDARTGKVLENSIEGPDED